MKLKITIKSIIIALSILAGCSAKINFEEKVNEILDWESCNGEFKDEQFNEVFQLIEENPSLLEYDISDVDYMRVITSDDGNVRAYVLEKCGFGGNPSDGFSTKTLIQYKVDDLVKTYRLEENYFIIDKIYSLDDSNYLILDSWGILAQGSQNYKRARVFRIDSDGIKQVKDIFDLDGGLSDEIKVYWEEGASEEDGIYDDMCKNHDVEYVDDLIIHFCKGELYVANTRLSSDSHRVIDGTYKHYEWDETRFKDVTLMSPYHIRNSDYHISIEQEPDGYCTYRCWNGGEKNGYPDLIIRKGTRQVWDEADVYDYNRWIEFDDSFPLLGELYSFENKGYKYICHSGWIRGRMQVVLSVYSPEGNMVYSKEFDDS